MGGGAVWPDDDDVALLTAESNSLSCLGPGAARELRSVLAGVSGLELNGQLYHAVHHGVLHHLPGRGADQQGVARGAELHVADGERELDLEAADECAESILPDHHFPPRVVASQHIAIRMDSHNLHLDKK